MQWKRAVAFRDGALDMRPAGRPRAAIGYRFAGRDAMLLTHSTGKGGS
jgi:hypothetical protein